MKLRFHFSFLFSSLLLFLFFVYSRNIRVFLPNRGRKLSFKFLSVEVERVLLSIIRAYEGGEGEGTNIKTNEYKIFDFARCWRNYFSKKERNEFFTVIGSIVELSIDVSIFFFFFFWLENEFFVRDGSDNLMELVKKRNEIINGGKFEIVFYEILFLSSQYQCRVEYFFRTFRNNL